MPENKDSTQTLSTKEKIINASMKLFSELGYKNASVRKIASAVGIRESALYAYIGVSGHCCRFSSDSLRRDIFCNNILA